MLALPWAIARRTTQRATEGLGGFLQGGGHNFRWKIEVSPQMLDSIIGKVPIIVHPRECLPHKLLGFKALHQLDHLQIRNIDLRMLR